MVKIALAGGLLAVAALNRAPEVRAGVVATHEGRSVLAMAAPQLEIGATLTMVTPDLPQTTTVARVVRTLTDDAYMRMRPNSPGPYYEISSVEAGRTLPQLAIAIVGDLSARRVGSTVSLHLDGASPDVRARSCTSIEGLHLTLWAGEPLKAPRLWHLYYYVGYDLQPSCTPEDTRG
jgi:hypothetical protein